MSSSQPANADGLDGVLPRRPQGERADVLIVGGGLVGQTLALALDSLGLNIAVVERAAPDALLAVPDGRASAIASASARMLRALGLGGLLDAGQPIAGIEVGEGRRPDLLTFLAPAAGEPLGIMVENVALRRALADAMAGRPGIRLVAPARLAGWSAGHEGATLALADGRVLSAPLLVAADGRKSRLREEAGIRSARWPYRARAMVSMLTHAHAHDGVAFELFHVGGPLALLPMRDLPDGRHRSALVWTVRPEVAAGLERLSARGFAHEVSEAMGPRLLRRLGRVERIAPVEGWPLAYHHAERYHAGRLVLVGDSAHGIHPVAGQGLNLGFRDAAALAEAVTRGLALGLEPGDRSILEDYARQRRPDNALTAFATDTLSRLFDVPGRPASVVRRTGLALTERMRGLKGRFMATARGEGGDQPSLLRGELPGAMRSSDGAQGRASSASRMGISSTTG